MKTDWMVQKTFLSLSTKSLDSIEKLDHEYINNAVEEFLRKGGTIKKVLPEIVTVIEDHSYESNYIENEEFVKNLIKKLQ